MQRDPPKALSAAATRVQQALAAAGLDCEITEHARPARTSAEAAATLGCHIGEIAKSLVFRAATAAAPDGLVLVVASGANRVDEAKLAALCDATIGKADAVAVREATGYAIGGIPPFAHARRLPTYIDRDLLAFERVYAAGGTPNAMFPIRPADLVRVCSGIIADVTLLSP
jgi:prolyl-tRNA editing enzyme YbaK/EbsC (Cys-tRNA(Pro) deacylase)